MAEQSFSVNGGAYLKDLQKLVSRTEDDLREPSQELPEPKTIVLCGEVDIVQLVGLC